MHVVLASQNAAIELDIRPREQARALVDAGYSVTVVAPSCDVDAARAVLDQRVAYQSFPLPAPASGMVGQVREQVVAFLCTALALVRVARRRRVDVIHAANPPDNVWLMAILLRLIQGKRVCFVYDQHDVAPVLLREKFSSSRWHRPLAWVAGWLETRSFKLADLVVFASPAYAERAAGLGVTAPHVVVPNGWTVRDGGLTQDWHEGAHALIAYVGAISDQDDVTHLVDAVAALRRPNDVRVVVAGDGSALREVQARAAQAGVSEPFTWLGWVADRKLIASLLEAADICVAPETDSAFNRLASLVKIGEYMSAGAAVAAHRLPLTELVAGDAVEYASDMTASGLASAIDRLIDDKARRVELGRRARRRFDEELAWDSVGSPRLTSAYASFLGLLAQPGGSNRSA